MCLSMVVSFWWIEDQRGRRRIGEAEEELCGRVRVVGDEVWRLLLLII